MTNNIEVAKIDILRDTKVTKQKIVDDSSIIFTSNESLFKVSTKTK